MEYILNKTPIRTSNNYKINDFKIDLNILETPYNEYLVKNNKVITKSEKKANFTSKIGLEAKNYLDLSIKSDNNYDKPIFIEYDFDKNSYLAGQINIDIKENEKNDYIVIFKGKNDEFLNQKVVIKSSKDSISNISIINLLSTTSKSFIAVENIVEENAISTVNFIDLGGLIKVSNYYSIVEENAKNYFNMMYYGKEKDKLDMNYYIINKGKNSVSDIKVEGALNDNSIKSFKGTIDFIEGAKNSKGDEIENCVLLSEDVVSRSLPILLCHEEEVEGSHGVSTGKIDEEKLFYLTSRGLSEDESKRLIIESNFKKIIEKIPDEETKNEIFEKINQIL